MQRILFAETWSDNDTIAFDPQSFGYCALGVLANRDKHDMRTHDCA